jgi:hypothetical protein
VALSRLFHQSLEFSPLNTLGAASPLFNVL